MSLEVVDLTIGSVPWFIRTTGRQQGTNQNPCRLPVVLLQASAAANGSRSRKKNRGHTISFVQRLSMRWFVPLLIVLIGTAAAFDCSENKFVEAAAENKVRIFTDL
jgi:hypothetical protein